MNAGIYAFDEGALRDVAARIGNENAQSEYYLTDTVELLIARRPARRGGRRRRLPQRARASTTGSSSQRRARSSTAGCAKRTCAPA